MEQMQENRESEFLQVFRRKMQVSPCNLLIIILNTAVFIVSELLGYQGKDISEYGALSAAYVWEQGEYYRVLTYMFLHGGLEHLLNNMLILWFLGDNLERHLGHLKYLLVYFGSGILAGIASMGYNSYMGYRVVCVGASGAIFGVVGGVAVLIIVHRGRMEGLTTRQILLFIALSLYGGFTSRGVDNAAHIGGMIAGVVGTLVIWAIGVLTRRSKGEEK